MDDAKSQLVDKLKSANNVLVTVSRNPSVDQLSALLGLTLLLNKQGKHTAAVFSGEVPSTIEFLQPGETIEKNTDSLRDFIIALDKSKADKLRYKVEDNVVRIFITPYKTSISQDDLDFSQGDFNVDVVVALGVQQQGELDEAITAHGRILHDATIATINTAGVGDLGSINWHDQHASSLSELVTELVDEIDSSVMDNQIATALLTGIVAETDRFSNEKTSPQTMSVSAKLMAAGANQQLVASKLAEPPRETGGSSDHTRTGAALHSDDDQPPKDDGTIDIDHGEKSTDNATDNDQTDESSKPSSEPGAKVKPKTKAKTKTPTAVDTASDDTAKPVLDDTPQDTPALADQSVPSVAGTGSKLVTEPPQLGGMLTANSQTEPLTPSTDPMSLPTSEPPQLLDHDAPSATLSPLSASLQPAAASPTPLPQPAPASVEPADQGLTPPPVGWTPPDAVPTSPATTPLNSTLSQLEAAVASPHTGLTGITNARDEVNKAIDNSNEVTDVASEPITALNAQPFGGDLHQPAGVINPDGTALLPVSHTDNSASPGPHLDDILNHELKLANGASGAAATDNTAAVQPSAGAPAPASPQVTDSTAPPPVPPPIPFQFGSPTPPPPPPQP